MNVRSRGAISVSAYASGLRCTWKVTSGDACFQRNLLTAKAATAETWLKLFSKLKAKVLGVKRPCYKCKTSFRCNHLIVDEDTHLRNLCEVTHKVLSIETLRRGCKHHT